MSHKEVIEDLARQVAQGRMTRRAALRRAAALGVSAAAVGALGMSAAAQGTPAAEGSPAASPVASSYEPQGPQVEKLVLWTRSSADTSPNEWRGLTDASVRYTELVGTPVELVTVPDDAFRGNLSRAAPGGDGPDVFGPVAHDWIGELAVQEIALPWAEGDIQGSDDIQPNAIEAVVVDGQVYGYPVFSETLALYRNTDLVPEAPATWDELVSVATELTDGDQYGFAFNLLAQYYQGAVFHGFGSYIFKSNEGTLDINDIGLNNEGGVEAAKFLRDMYNNQQPPLPEAVLDQANAGAFLDGLEESGLVGMTINGPWRELPLTDAGINYEINALPTLPNGNALQPFSGIQVFGVNAYSEVLDAAKDLVNFLGNNEGVQLMVAGYNKAPVRTSLRDAAIALNPNMGMWMDAFEQGVPMPNIPQMGQVWTPWGDAMVGIITNNVSDEEVQSLLDTAVEQIKANIQQ